MRDEGYYFTSTLFEIEQGEDEETNPGCYGKALAAWIAARLTQFGYEPYVVPEDWGWCVVCMEGEYWLWVGCSAVHDAAFYDSYDPASHPDGKDVEWYVFTHVEIPFFKVRSIMRKWFGRLDTDALQRKLAAELHSILSDEAEIVLSKT
ncbi:MAG TPA: hypothetical protein VKP65_20515 [Rhodothermales bacterium]|nr:hypothetical protein [Rhodothermales bacterium]